MNFAIVLLLLNISSGWSASLGRPTSSVRGSLMTNSSNGRTSGFNQVLEHAVSWGIHCTDSMMLT